MQEQANKKRLKELAQKQAELRQQMQEASELVAARKQEIDELQDKINQKSKQKQTLEYLDTEDSGYNTGIQPQNKKAK